jgi:hypothetical protein
MPPLGRFSTPSESFSTSLLNVAVQALMIFTTYARFRAKEYNISALAWDDCKPRSLLNFLSLLLQITKG